MATSPCRAAIPEWARLAADMRARLVQTLARKIRKRPVPFHETDFPFTVIVTLVMKIFPWQYDRYPSMESAGCKRIFAPVVRKAGNRHPLRAPLARGCGRVGISLSSPPTAIAAIS